MKQLIIRTLVILTVLPMAAMAQYTPLPDGKNENPSRHIAFMENKGQIGDLNNNPVPSVKFAHIQSVMQGYALVDGKFVYQILKKDSLPNDTIQNDSLFSLAQTLVTSVENVITPVSADPVAYEQKEGVHNFYKTVCPNGVTGVLSYKRLIYPSVYSNIDYHVYSNTSGFKFYFEIKPGGDPDDIRVLFEGQDAQNVTNAEIELFMGSLQLGLENAIAYQLNAQNQVVPITSWSPGFVENTDGTVSFTTGSYNTSQTLVIQIAHPLLPSAPQSTHNPKHNEWSSYVTGGGFDKPHQVFNDDQGFTYLAGETNSLNFSLINGKLPYGGGGDAYAVKFKPNGVPDFGTYFGKAGWDRFTCGIALKNGRSFWGGNTSSSGLPVNTTAVNPGKTSGMVVGLDADGTVLGLPLFYGGEEDDEIVSMAYNGSNRIAVVGNTVSNQSSPNIFPSKLAHTSSFAQPVFGGGITDGFIGEFDTNRVATSMVYSTWIGGDKIDNFYSVSYDGNNNMYVIGNTESGGSSSTCSTATVGNLPICNPSGSLFSQTFQGGGTDLYVLSLGPNRDLTWSSYMGSSNDDGGVPAIVADKTSTKVYIAASTWDYSTFPKAAGSSGFSWAPNNSTIALQLQVFQLDNRTTISWSTAIGCDSNDSHLPKLALSKDFLFLTYVTGCETPQASASYCTAPSAGSNEMVICDNSGQLWLQDNGSGVVFKSNTQSMLAAFDMLHNLKWSTPYGGSGSQYKPSISYDKLTDRVYTSGITTAQNDIPLQKLPDPNSHYQRSLAGSQLGGYIARFAANLNAVSVQEITSSKMNIKAFPNPSSSVLFIEIEGIESIGYEMMSINGQLVQSGKISVGNNGIDVSALSSGMYIISLKSSESSGVVRFVKE